MKLIKQVIHPEATINIFEIYENELGQYRYAYEYKDQNQNLTGGWGPNNEIVYQDMVSALTAAHSFLPDSLKNLMKLEYLLP